MSSSRVAEERHTPMTPPPVRIKRLNINLPERTFDELQDLARSSGRTMTDMVRIALALVVLAVEETQRGNRLAVTSKDGHILREIVMPR